MRSVSRFLAPSKSDLPMPFLITYSNRRGRRRCAVLFQYHVDYARRSDVVSVLDDGGIFGPGPIGFLRVHGSGECLSHRARRRQDLKCFAGTIDRADPLALGTRSAIVCETRCEICYRYGPRWIL